MDPRAFLARIRAARARRRQAFWPSVLVQREIAEENARRFVAARRGADHQEPFVFTGPDEVVMLQARTLKRALQANGIHAAVVANGAVLPDRRPAPLVPVTGRRRGTSRQHRSVRRVRVASGSRGDPHLDDPDLHPAGAA
jgi:hypothetical protein